MSATTYPPNVPEPPEPEDQNNLEPPSLAIIVSGLILLTLLIILWPMSILWAIKVLFGITIEFTFKSFAAIWIIQGVLILRSPY